MVLNSQSEGQLDMVSENNRLWTELIAESEAVEAAIREAVRDALLCHKRAGNTVAAWQDGKVQWIAADKIDLAEFETLAAAAATSESTR
jgi:hypothetical protein